MNASPKNTGKLAEARAETSSSGLESAEISPQEKMREFGKLLKMTDNEHQLALVMEKDAPTRIAIASPDRTNVIAFNTRISEAQYKEILEKILPIPETLSMLYDLGMAYGNRTPIMLEGGTAIGKTYSVNRFAELLYGPKVKIPDFYCNGQTDVSELMGKYVPAGLTPQQLARISEYLKSDAGAALKAEMKGDGDFSQQALVERAALELKLPVQKGSFAFQLGVLPKAMTGTMGADGIMQETPDGPGCMLHIQEVGMAAPSVVNALLKIRGDKGKLAADIQVHEDGGRLVESGEGFFIVLSTNPPGKGFKERFEVDTAFARALVWKNLPDQLSSQSMQKIGSKIFDCSKVERRAQSPGAILDLRKHTQLGSILGDVALKFHQLFHDKLRDGEPGRKQKVPVTIDSLWKVAEILQNHQIPKPDFSGVDFVATLKGAIKAIYIDALRDKPDTFGAASLADAAKATQSLGAELMKQLDTILTSAQVEEITFEGKKMTRIKAIEILSDRAFGGGKPAPAEASKAAAKAVGDEQKLGGALGELEEMLGGSSLLGDLKGVLGVDGNKNKKK